MSLRTLVTLAALSCSLFSAISFSQTVDPQQQNWEKFLGIVELKGKMTATPFGDYMTLANIEPMDEAESHAADYFSLVGVMGEDQKFSFSTIEVVSEKWQLNVDGNWQIDQFLFRISPAGEILKSYAVDMIQTPSRTILKFEYKNLDQAAMSTNWERVKNGWYSRIGLDLMIDPIN